MSHSMRIMGFTWGLYLGLEVVGREKISNPTTSRVELPTKLLTVEQALLCLRGAMKGLERMGIDKTEILRMRSLVQVSKIYLEKFAEYLDYRRIERELVELRKEVAGLRNEAEKDAKTRDR
jgi:hypothetical protein